MGAVLEDWAHRICSFLSLYYIGRYVFLKAPFVHTPTCFPGTLQFHAVLYLYTNILLCAHAPPNTPCLYIFILFCFCTLCQYSIVIVSCTYTHPQCPVSCTRTYRSLFSSGYSLLMGYNNCSALQTLNYYFHCSAQLCIDIPGPNTAPPLAVCILNSPPRLLITLYLEAVKVKAVFWLQKDRRGQ